MSQADSQTSSTEHGGRRRLMAVVAAVAVAALTLSYLGAFVWVGPSIPRGTSVAGVAIGGMTDAEAVSVLKLELAGRAETIQIEVAGRERSYNAARLGLSFDADATVASVPRREATPQALVVQLGGQEVEPVVEVDQRRLDRMVRSIARRVDDAARQPRIEYDGLSVVVVEPRSGAELDRELAATSIADGYLGADETLELAATAVVPFVSAEEVAVVAATDAEDAISAPVTLAIEGKNITVRPQQIASVLSFRAREGGMRAMVDAELLRALIATPLAEVGDPAEGATFDVTSGRPRVVPSQYGRGVSDDSLAAGMVEALAADDRSVSLSLERIEPDLTTAEARDLEVTEVISTFTQEFPYAEYRVTNIGVAADEINGTVLEPGETFSLNGVVGERTPENGFVKGFIIVGNRLVEDYGGAVSTITTAMWNTAFFAGMTRVEQRAHGFWISRYLPGLEATVSWGNLDLRFRNDTPNGVYITSTLTDSSVTTTMWSTRYWDIEAEFGPRENPRPAGTVYDEGEECIEQVGVDGFDITVTRVWSRGGDVERREPLFTTYDAAPTVICAPKPVPEPADEPSEKPSDRPSEKPGNSNQDN